MQKVLSKVLEKATPLEGERSQVSKFSKSVLDKLKKQGYKAELEGSLAKDTWVSGDHDVDMFVFFKENVPREKLEKEGIALGKKIIKSLGGKPELGYAEHPYVKSKIGDFNLDIVPCYKLKHTEQLKSAVDRTPFHTKYVKENLKKNQKGQVRLLKQFAKGIGVYSAKERVRGFSGYLCELLILKYKSFEKVIKDAKKWNYGKIIDLESHHANKKELGNRFKHALIVIDPIDKKRNVAAALNPNNFEKFVYACQRFLKKPSEKFFFPNKVKPLSKQELEKTLAKHGRFLLLKFKKPDLVEDVLYSQLRKSLKSLEFQLEKESYKVSDSAQLSNGNCYFLLELEYIKLPKLKKIEGPPVKIREQDQKKFTDKYKKFEPWVEHRRWYVKVPRKYTDVVALLRHLLKDPRTLGIGKYISDSMKKNYKLLQDQEILSEYKGEFAEFLTAYLLKKKPWEW